MRLILASCLFALYLIEASIMPWLFPHGWLDVISLRLVLVGVMFIGIFSTRQSAFVYGLIFGFLYDVMHYVYMIGFYTLLFALTGYLVGLFARKYSLHFTPAIVLVAVSLLFFEMAVHIIYSFYGRINISFFVALIRNMIPSVIVNAIFAAILFQPAERLFLNMHSYAREEG